MEEVTQKELDSAFPHGIMVAQDGEGQNFALGMVEVKTSEDGEVVILGWAYPNKDFYFFPENVIVKNDGDWLLRSKGRQYRFAPLTEQQGKDLIEDMRYA